MLYLLFMGKFNWWRRNKKQQPLKRENAFKGKSFVLQQIEHGDFDYSDYYRQAKVELDTCSQLVAEVKASWKYGPESLQDEVMKIEQKYIKRHNKLMEDHDKEEHRLLVSLKEALIKETKQDVWDEAINAGADSLTQFYYNYKDLTKQKLCN